MKALVLTSTDGTLEYTDVDDPSAGPGSALVKLSAAGLNRRDYWITAGGYPNIQAPSILGSDGCGVVEAVGEGGDESWIGKEVILHPSLDWGDSEEAQGPNFRILGMPDNGTFAEKIAVPLSQLVEKPTHLSQAEAAALPLATLTAYRALFSQGGLQAGDTILITGAGGGVATIALQLATAAGAKVLVNSSSADKLKRAAALGAADGANYTKENWAADLAERHGKVDLILDGAAGRGFNDLIGLVRPGGRIINYGGTAGLPTDLNIRAHFWNQLHLIGSTMGSPADFAGMISFVGSHQIKPVIHSITPLSEGAALVASMAEVPQFGKLVLEIA